MSDWKTCSVVRDKGGWLWLRAFDGGAWLSWQEPEAVSDAHLERYYGPIAPVLDADGRPVVTTVGDLTARHIGRRVRLYDGPTFTLRGLQSFIRGELGDFTQLAAEWDDDGPDDDWDYTERPLDTPCEVLP